MIDRKDVLIIAPPAYSGAAAPMPGGPEGPSKDELISHLWADNQRLNTNVEMLRQQLSTVAERLIDCMWLLIDLGHGIDGETIEIPLELAQRLRAKAFEVTSDKTPAGDILLRFRERVGVPFEIES